MRLEQEKSAEEKVEPLSAYFSGVLNLYTQEQHSLSHSANLSGVGQWEEI